MKQFRITTDNLSAADDNDCVLDSSDPIYEIKSIKYLAGLGHGARLHEYKVDQGSNPSVTGMENQRLEKQHNIKAGTPEWFQLWFSLPYLTGEKKVGNK